MKLVTYAHDSGSRAGLLDGDHIFDLQDAADAFTAQTGAAGAKLPHDVKDLLDLGDVGLTQARRVLAFAQEQGGDAPFACSAADATLLPPITRPGKIICLAGNFADHIREGGDEPPEKSQQTPRYFWKPNSVLVGPEQPVRLWEMSAHVDWELELAAVIGKAGRDISAADAPNYIAGYTIFNDISSREMNLPWEREEREMDDYFDWLNGKWFDTHGPMGPAIVTADEIPDPHNLAMSLSVNGIERQRGNTGQMIFNCFELIEYLTRIITLEPGDIISTGTPAGVGAAAGTELEDGDVIVGTIELLGTLRNPVIG
jgi:2-keto-4-pentenoate hydratase/2-oxohepta-3-ene-1,7-dioic acid hydratase in catechol pathway